MSTLSKEALPILEDFARQHIRDGKRFFKTEDVVVDHEDRIEYFPELERRRLIVRDSSSHGYILEHVKHFRILFRGIRETSFRDPETAIVRNLWTVLRQLRREKRSEVDLAEVTSKTSPQLTLDEVGRGLHYAFYDLALCSFSLHPDDAPYASISKINLPVRLLNKEHRDFDTLIRELDKEVQSTSGEQEPKAPRVKGEKFGVLDSPKHREADLKAASGILGVAYIYIDVDDFKQVNSRFTETDVDRDLLPAYQTLLSRCVDNLGYAYAEGGDEVTILLPNTTSEAAVAIAEGIRRLIETTKFQVSGNEVLLTVSGGVAHQIGGDLSSLPGLANAAKKRAKIEGKNRIRIGTPASLPLVHLPSIKIEHEPSDHGCWRREDLDNQNVPVWRVRVTATGNSPLEKVEVLLQSADGIPDLPKVLHPAKLSRDGNGTFELWPNAPKYVDVFRFIESNRELRLIMNEADLIIPLKSYTIALIARASNGINVRKTFRFEIDEVGHAHRLFDTIESEKQTFSTPALSQEAQQLLKRASQSKDGMIFRLPVMGGPIIRVQDEVFATGEDAKQLSRWEKGIKELEASDLIDPLSHKRELFTLTSDGWDLAEKL